MLSILSRVALLKKAGALLAIFLLFLFISETYLAFKGYALPDPNNLEAAHFDDLDCGWLPIPGQSYSREDPQAKTTVGNNFCRLTCSPEQAPSWAQERQEALLLGCSYTFGMGVKDEETFGWLLNQKQQRFYFTNGGVIGYSTYQCLKRLEKFLQNGAKPRLVIYAFINDHLMRNVSCRIFGKAAESFDFIETPYFEVQPSGQAIFHPLRNLAWPGEKYLRTVNFTNRLYVNHLIEKTRQVRFNKEASHQVYRHLVEQMAKLCQQHGAALTVVSLDTSSNWLSPTFTDAPVLYLNANCEDLYKPEYHVMNRLDFHPAPVAHRFWADKIANFIEKIELP